jgi:hypothetical protein
VAVAVTDSSRTKYDRFAVGYRAQFPGVRSEAPRPPAMDYEPFGLKVAGCYMCLTTASPKPEQVTFVAPSIMRWKS